MKKMALDIGDVRVGIAVSDPLNIVANPRETYMSAKNLDTDVNYFINYAKKENCDTIIIGLPMNMDGTHGEMVEKVKRVGQRIQELSDLDVVYQDERLTTVSAEKMLISANVRRDKRKKVIDKVAATIILEAYLSKNKF